MRLAAVMAAALVTGGCSAGSGDAPAASSSAGAPGTVTFSRTAPVPDPPASPPSGSATPTATGSVPPPPQPVVAAGNQGAWTLTRAAPGRAESEQVRTLQCEPDGVVESGQLLLTAGGTRLTLVGATPAESVGVQGTSTVDAAGGTFAGRNADTAVSFTWVC